MLPTSLNTCVKGCIKSDHSVSFFGSKKVIVYAGKLSQSKYGAAWKVPKKETQWSDFKQPLTQALNDCGSMHQYAATVNGKEELKFLSSFRQPRRN